MSQISRRLFFLLLGVLIPGVITQKSGAATTKKPTPTPTPTPTSKKPSPTPTSKKPSPTPTSKKPSPTPTSKKPSPTPTSKKPSPTPTSTGTGKTIPSAQPTESNVLEGIVIAKSSDLTLRQTKVFYLKDSFGISTGYSLTRTNRGVVAFNTKCTHAGVPTILSGAQLQCPAHGSIFNPENGEVIRGPAFEPLKLYRTIEVNAEIRIVIS